MNRRSFFKKAASGAAVLATTPLVLSKPFMAQTLESRDDYGFVADKHQMPTQDSPGWVSYKFHMKASIPPNSNYRIRYIDAKSGPEITPIPDKELYKKPYQTYIFGKDAMI